MRRLEFCYFVHFCSLFVTPNKSHKMLEKYFQKIFALSDHQGFCCVQIIVRLYHVPLDPLEDLLNNIEGFLRSADEAKLGKTSMDIALLHSLLDQLMTQHKFPCLQ